MHYQLRIDNASPLVLNGLAAVGTTSKPDETPKVLVGNLRVAAQEHDRPGERGSRQGAGTQERDQARGPRLERALSSSCRNSGSPEWKAWNENQRPPIFVVGAALQKFNACAGRGG